jgi:dynactin complex subunit
MYVGEVEGVAGTFAGVELPFAGGRNDGSAKGNVYFKCAPKHGLFVALKKDRIRNPQSVAIVHSPQNSAYIKRQQLAREKKQNQKMKKI